MPLRLAAAELTAELTTEVTAEVTAAELIAERVRAECDRRPTDAAGVLAVPRVIPTAQEQALNAAAERRPEKETEIPAARALDAFAAGAFLLMVDDRQVESAEEPVRLTDGTVVTFLRLTPLVGGLNRCPKPKLLPRPPPRPAPRPEPTQRKPGATHGWTRRASR